MNSNMEIAGNTIFRVGRKLIEAEEIEFRCGKGRVTMKNQLVEIVGNNISMKSMGEVKLKGQNIYKEEGEENSSETGDYDEQYRLVAEDGETPLENRRYRITASNGQTWEGVSDADGLTQRVSTNTSVELTVEVLPDEETKEIV